MKIDLHNHTVLCNHATGTVEEYIERAISSGIDIFGFSDHAPMGFDEKYRMRLEQLPSYITQIRMISSAYSTIEVLCGLEVDYLPNHLEHEVLSAPVDYLIGSVHFLDEWGFDNPEFIGGYKERDIDTVWKLYFETLQSMAESGLFDIVGHFDLIKVFKFYPHQDIVSLAMPALNAIKKSGMCVELNAAGLRKPVQEQYPSLELLNVIKSLEIPITLGCDAHSPEQVGYGLDEIITLAKSVGYTQCATFRNRKPQMINF